MIHSSGKVRIHCHRTRRWFRNLVRLTAGVGLATSLFVAVGEFRAATPPSEGGASEDRDAPTQPDSDGLVAQQPPPVVPQETPPPTGEKLLDLPLEDIARQPVRTVVAPALEQAVTSVTRTTSTVGKSPSAISVVTQDDIHRTGVRSIPEALRQVPGMEVARINSNSWAVGARGFNNSSSDKLLVNIDGRSVYARFFGGVSWSSQDVFLEDVDRIEVIRGPGATIWGANAVNGVVNVVTKSAKDTQGSFFETGFGTEERIFSGFRHGDQLGDGLYYRVYGKQFERGTFVNPTDEPHDDWRAGQMGARMDWEVSCEDTITFQGDIFDNYVGNQSTLGRFPAGPGPSPFSFVNITDTHNSGGNLLWRWRHEYSKDADFALQIYYDNFQIHVPRLIAFDADTLDFDFNMRFALDERQKIVWGAGYRFDKLNDLGENPFVIAQIPTTATTNLFSTFVEDQITLVPDHWFLTVGSKFEAFTFDGFQYQPTARLLYAPDEKQAYWAAVSRAVRTPNFLNETLRIRAATSPVLPVFIQLNHGAGLEAEDLMAYELGYRAQPTEAFSYDIALFYNVYRNLIVTKFGTPAPGPPPVFIPVDFVNGMNGEVYGVEMSAKYQVNKWWHLSGNYAFRQIQLHRRSDLAARVESPEGTSAHNQVYLRSSWDVSKQVQVDVMGRYVDNLPTASPYVPSYLSLDARVAWKPNDCWEFAVVGQNLLQETHREFSGTPTLEIPRGVFGSVTVRW